MSDRESIYVSTRTPCDGGESPNRYVDHITAEVRLFYPPQIVGDGLVLAALQEAYQQAYDELRIRAARSVSGNPEEPNNGE